MRQIAEHFDRRREEFRRYSSGVLTDADLDAMYFRLSPDGRAGIISGRIPLTEGADVHVFERVVLSNKGHVEIAQYSYFLVVGREEIRGYELDPTHDPALHRHVEGHQREPSEPMTLRGAVEDFWTVLAERPPEAGEAEDGPVSHGELGMLSASVVDGDAPVKLIRFSLDPADGWWILAERDLPMPEVDDIVTACIHCVINHLDPNIGAGLDLARREAEADEDGVGLAYWHDARWVTGDEAAALGVLPM